MAAFRVSSRRSSSKCRYVYQVEAGLALLATCGGHGVQAAKDRLIILAYLGNEPDGEQQMAYLIINM